jgi:hypothetical protein
VAPGVSAGPGTYDQTGRSPGTLTDHLAFSPDGTRLAIADAAAATVTVWEV